MDRKVKKLGFLVLWLALVGCDLWPFGPEPGPDPPNPDLILLVEPDTTPYPYPLESILPRLRNSMLFFLKRKHAADNLCGDRLWVKPLPEGEAFEVLRFDTLIDFFPDHCVNFYDVWLTDTESLIVFTTGIPYDVPPLDTTRYPYHKLFLYDFLTGRLDTLHWGCPSYIDPRFSASGRYVFVATRGYRDRCSGLLWRYDRQTGQADSVLTFAGGPRYGGWSIYTGYAMEGDSVWIVQGDPVDMNVLPNVDPWEGRFVVMQKYYGPGGFAPGGLVVWDREGRVLYTLEVPWPSPWDFRPFAEYYPQWVEIPGYGRGILLNLFFDPGMELGGLYRSEGIWLVKHWERYVTQQEVVP